MGTLTFAFYNMGPIGEAVDHARAEVENRALGNVQPQDKRRRDPDFIGEVECIARNLVTLPGYHLFHNRRSESRANVALYVRDGVEHDAMQWWRGTKTWPNVEHPGTHPPRSTMWLPTELGLVGVGHAPQAPSRKAHTVEARAEWLAAHAERINGHKGPVLFLSDSNRLWDELKALCPGVKVDGTGVESVHAKHLTLSNVRTPEWVNGVQMRSDHHQCLLGRATAR